MTLTEVNYTGSFNKMTLTEVNYTGSFNKMTLTEVNYTGSFNKMTLTEVNYSTIFFKKEKYIFFRFFPIKILWDWFIAKFILILQKYFFWGYSKLAANQSLPGFKVLQTGKCKPCEIYRRICNVYGKACLNQKNVYKLVKYGFATTSLSWKDSPWSGSTPTLL